MHRKDWAAFGRHSWGKSHCTRTHKSRERLETIEQARTLACPSRMPHSRRGLLGERGARNGSKVAQGKEQKDEGRKQPGPWPARSLTTSAGHDDRHPAASSVYYAKTGLTRPRLYISLLKLLPNYHVIGETHHYDDRWYLRVPHCILTVRMG